MTEIGRTLYSMKMDNFSSMSLKIKTFLVISYMYSHNPKYEITSNPDFITIDLISIYE